ncbi:MULTISPECIES: hypothetical protein [unclassified Bradyrhizobium]|uniref:hypothetical protein n=1 Tax=unclassified Bradyrhizobium TaxID=2631580 RepID=UPI0028EF8109|nr:MULTISPECIES: hypothetical protein [unclassified Bradyrhizobium]
MSEQATIVSAGRAALERINAGTKRLFEDYLAVGDALLVGRSQCLKLAGSNSLQTPAYRAHWRQWLNANGFNMETHERLSAIWIAEHKAEVVRWRDELSEAAKRHCNHPNVIVAHMKAGTEPAARGPKPKQRTSADRVRGDALRAGFYGPRPARPEQDLIRRVADAMRSSGKQDWLQLACIAIEALTVEDLRDLMPAKDARTAPAVEIHAA